MEKLNKTELLDLIRVYSDYVIEFYEYHDKNMLPVCINEFYDNEWQELKKRW